MVTLRAARRVALSLPEAQEADHHGFPSFRVRNKIFATQPDDEHFHVMLAPEEVDMAVSMAPDACAKMWWGKKLAGVRVALAAADAALLAEFLKLAWRRRAPRALLTRLDAPADDSE